MVSSEKIAKAAHSLKQIEAEYTPAAFACSFGPEDMVLLDLIAAHARHIEVFTLDTGRLPAETYTLMDQVRDRYSVPLRIYFPERDDVEAWVEQNGINGFYRSVAQRKQCCHIRKVVPLGRALLGKKAWVTGLRREQSATRQAIEEREWDASNQTFKFCPLLEWTADEVWSYVRSHDVPYNALHDHGYPSIGCAPCTRAVAPGEDVRAGRWWWEEPEGKECGLHVDRSAPA
jgi:phosphoadenosine phosphosulfate reductase